MAVFTDARVAWKVAQRAGLPAVSTRPVGRRWERPYVAQLVALDTTAAVSATVLAALTPGSWAARLDASTYPWFIGLPIAWIAALMLTRAYEPRYLGLGSEEFHRLSRAGIGMLAGIGTFAWVTRTYVDRDFVSISVSLAFVLTVLGRYAARKRLHAQRRRGLHSQRVVAVGHPHSVADLVRQLRQEQYHGLEVIGACVPSRSVRPLPSPRGSTDELAELGVPVLGGFDDVIGVVTGATADTVAVLTCPEMDGPALRHLAWDLEQTPADLVVAPGLMEMAGPRIAVRPACGLPLLYVEEPEFTGPRRIVKRGVDLATSTLALLLLAPVMAGIAIAIRSTTRGPVFFTQTRVGQDGAEFRMLKFRTMCEDAEQRLPLVIDLNERSEGLLFKIRDDPRVTGVGRFLRRYSLDELPQLINIFVGHMSLVGPRPPLPREVASYDPDVRRRLLVKPGLTGLWQISGRSDLSWDESVRLDLRYVENWSPTLDILIVWKTVFAVLRGSGAY
jgi:exopolysaccharide biosynthesis polyprenyl glycosylphosphotransferase